MKSKQNDAELIAEAYAKVEVQEEMVGALARGAAVAGRGLVKAAKSDAAKKIVKGTGKAVKKTAETVGGAALGAAGGAAGGIAKAVSGVAQGAIEGTVGAVQGAVDGATGGLGKAAKGAGENAAASFVSDEEDSDHDAPKNGISSRSSEHAEPVEVDMSENPAPESLEVIKAPAIHPDVEDAQRCNHHDDSEMKMALAELYKIEKYAFGLSLMLKEMPSLEGWTAAKITKAADYLGSVFHKLDYDFASGEHADGVEDSE